MSRPAGQEWPTIAEVFWSSLQRSSETDTREGGLTKAAFEVDWERKVVTCPAGNESISWLPSTYTKNGMVFEARFARRDCFPCP
jgi:hypothetical protein